MSEKKPTQWIVTQMHSEEHLSWKPIEHGSYDSIAQELAEAREQAKLRTEQGQAAIDMRDQYKRELAEAKERSTYWHDKWHAAVADTSEWERKQAQLTEARAECERLKECLKKANLDARIGGKG